MSLARRIAVARGDEPADLVSGRPCPVGVHARVARRRRRRRRRLRRRARRATTGGERLDASGRYVVPGFIDAHVHIESSKLIVDEFARLVLPLGTTAVVADPHEIANVLGTDGVHWLLDVCDGTAARRLGHGLVVRARVRVRVAAPPADARRPRRALLRRRHVLGARRDDELPRRHRRRRGRAGASSSCAAPSTSTVTPPACSAGDLQAYAGRRHPLRPRGVHARGGPGSAAGRMWVLIREASIARNLRALAAARGASSGRERCAFCTDDREPDFVVREGHVEPIVPRRGRARRRLPRTRW